MFRQFTNCLRIYVTIPSMKILIIHPMLSSLTEVGACEQDRIVGAKQLQALGHQVKVLALSNPFHTPQAHHAFYQQRGLDATIIPFQRAPLRLARLKDVAFLDGAGWEYADPAFSQAIRGAIQSWQPNMVWCHTTYLWHPAKVAAQAGMPVIVRSTNFEPLHFWQETPAKTLPNRVRYFGKWLGERRAMAFSQALAAITPQEASLYEKLARPGAAVSTLPLRTLATFLRPPKAARKTTPLHAFFMGASYKVAHNRQALHFIAHQVMPALRKHAPGQFIVHVLGGKVPDTYTAMAASDLVFDGFVPDLEAHLAGMDIALMPSLSGQGMQQKIFEAACRGIPTITHERALVGYPLKEAFAFANDAASFVEAMVELLPAEKRENLSVQASQAAHQLFSQDRLDALVTQILENAS
jgi:Glycosyl transferases group 1/Glycosyl transferase 4-like domain